MLFLRSKSRCSVQFTPREKHIGLHSKSCSSVFCNPHMPLIGSTRLSCLREEGRCMDKRIAMRDERTDTPRPAPRRPFQSRAPRADCRDHLKRECQDPFRALAASRRGFCQCRLLESAWIRWAAGEPIGEREPELHVIQGARRKLSALPSVLGLGVREPRCLAQWSASTRLSRDVSSSGHPCESRWMEQSTSSGVVVSSWLVVHEKWEVPGA